MVTTFQVTWDTWAIKKHSKTILIIRSLQTQYTGNKERINWYIATAFGNLNGTERRPFIVQLP